MDRYWLISKTILARSVDHNFVSEAKVQQLISNLLNSCFYNMNTRHALEIYQFSNLSVVHCQLLGAATMCLPLAPIGCLQKYAPFSCQFLNFSHISFHILVIFNFSSYIDRMYPLKWFPPLILHWTMCLTLSQCLWSATFHYLRSNWTIMTISESTSPLHTSPPMQ